jgi:predicted signal transduction protein with EAL and GGDEF domain
MKSNFELAAGAALDFAKGAFTVLVLGGLAAFFLKPGDIPDANIAIAIAVGLVISGMLLALSFYFNNKHNNTLK